MTLANVKVNNAPDAGTSGIYAVIMAGGAGTRLWPESRQARPKPFLPLAPDGRSLIAATSERLDGLVPEENRFVVAGRRFNSQYQSKGRSVGMRPRRRRRVARGEAELAKQVARGRATKVFAKFCVWR